MVFSIIRNKQVKITIRGKLIEQVHDTKFLGVTIDENLCWKPHIDIIRSKLARCVAVLYKAKLSLDSKTLLLLYLRHI